MAAAYACRFFTCRCGLIALALLVSATPRAAIPVAPQDSSVASFDPGSEIDRSIRWSFIPAGRFQMGCVPDDDRCVDLEKPRHFLQIAAFRMMTTDVTVGMYRAYAGRMGRTMLIQPDWNSRDDQPVVNVSWYDAAAFCRASGWRLPTEAEWEYAARGGLEGALYVWGNAATPVVEGRKMANVADETARRRNPGWTDLFGSYDDGYVYTSPVGVFPPNAFGLYDMAGNVWQWTSTLESAYPYRGDDGREDPDASGRRIIRGGSWSGIPRSLRVSYRVRDNPGDEDDYHGFRCVQSWSLSCLPTPSPWRGCEGESRSGQRIVGRTR